MKKKRVSLLVLLLALIKILTSSSSSSATDVSIGEWQMLTNQNFSSQIRLQPHALLLITVPWSGEFHSLMKEIPQLVTTDEYNDFSALKLMYMYRNTERVLADAIGVNELEGMVTVLYYHYSVSYKYSGKLRGFDILSSVKTYLSDERPIRTFESEEEVKVFVESTDKAVVLVEFCGWTSRLLANLNNNGSGDTVFFARGRMPIATGIDKKVAVTEIEHGNTQCGLQSGFSGSGLPWSDDFSVLNKSDYNSNQGYENFTSGDGLFCSGEEFQKFESFFSKFMTIAREYVLPPQRHRVGLVSNRSLLPSLGDQDPCLWSIMVLFNGCPSCTKIIKDSDNLKGALQTDGSIVMELEVDGQDLEPEIPVEKASVILFIDRASNSSEVRRKSKEALAVYRELALQHRSFDPKSSQYHDLSEKSSGTRLKRSPAITKINQKDKMSFTIISNGKPVSLDNIASDLSGGNLREILEGLLRKKEKTKLSALAKEVGFRLLSDDVDVEIANRLPFEVESYQVKTNIPAQDQLSHNEETRTVYDDIRNPPFLVESDQQILDDGTVLAEDGTVEGQSLPLDKSGDQKLDFEVFKGPFFFSDGNHRLLRALTGGLTIPSLVIIDSTSQQHYVFSENSAFSHSAMADFLQDFLNGTLLPYQRSELIPQGLREAANPPFINLDFHEVDIIPRVTTHTFTELVIGNKSDDVLVLFSNTWCGFCQRMELVVREVFRAIKGYTKSMKSETITPQTGFTSEKNTSAVMQAPSIYLFDCTLNDCNMILKSANQREVYPTLMLFPAENKNAIPYNGDISVKNVVKFIADYGSNSHHLIHEEAGILRNVAEKGGTKQDLVRDPEKPSHIDSPLTEILLKDRAPKLDIKYTEVKYHTSKSSPDSTSNVVVGSILKATDKLLHSRPFDNSEILIVKANQDIGFEGLILNKHINWDAFQKIENGLDFLKEASLSFGGPVMKQDMPLVALTRKTDKNQYPEALPGVIFLDQLATVHEIELLKTGNHSLVTDYWFFLGYSTWGWHQLFNEISEGAWNLSDSNPGDFVWPSNAAVLPGSYPLIE
ncbi:hypothetical protein ACFE04_030763 [Oxalis oulophora]